MEPPPPQPQSPSQEPAAQPQQGRNPCDQCRRRKVRCNYATPCDRCQSYGLACTRESIRKKRGPKQGRGRVLQQLRAQQHGDQPSTSQATSQALAMVPSPAGTIPDSPHQWTPDRPDSSKVHFDGDPQHTDYGPAVLPPTTEAQQQYAATWSQPPIPDAVDLDTSYFSFDEFTHNILASNLANLIDQPTDADAANRGPSLPDINSLLNHATPQSVPVISPYDFNAIGTPQTADATVVAWSSKAQLEVTPLVERAVDLFFTHLYPTYPLVDETRLRALLRNLPSTPEEVATRQPTVNFSDTCLIWSICALTLSMVDNWPAMSSEQRNITARRFVKQILSFRVEATDFMESPSHADVLVSLFIGNTWFELKRRTASTFYGREAITLAYAAGLHKDLPGFDAAERVRRKRTLALLFITERGAAVLHGFPVTIFSTPPMPMEVLEGEDGTVMLGLKSLHNLFSLLDQRFVRLWNEQSQDAYEDRGLADLGFLQEHLRSSLDMAGLSDIQRADILITQQWLRLIFWQTALRHGLLSTSAPDPAFSYTYPIEIAMCLCEIVKTLPPVAIQVHGLGIFEKQFEIAYSLMDALTLSATAKPEHHDCLRYLLLSLSASPSSRQVYVKTLEKKMDGASQRYRNLSGVKLLIEDSDSRPRSRRSTPAPPNR